jgi:ApaG protein
MTTTDRLNHVEVQVQSAYVPERSNPARGLYFYVYNVTITNRGAQACRLLTRHWIITDAYGNEEEVKGPGVVGETPHLEVGQSFTYTSFCPLKTPIGSMRGSYQLVNQQGERFDAPIPSFTLAREEEVN